jgi:hypothetical protein
MSTNELSGQERTDDEQRAESVAERLGRLNSFGAPTCDVCYGVESDNRPAEADFWPDPMTVYVDVDADSLVDWMTKVCDHHDTDNQQPTAATHRVRARAVYIGDEHRMNSAHRYEVLSVKEVDY